MGISPSRNKYLLFIDGFPFAGEHIAGIVNHRSIAQPLRCLAGAVLVAHRFSCLAGSRLIGVIGQQRREMMADAFACHFEFDFAGKARIGARTAAITAKKYVALAASEPW